MINIDDYVQRLTDLLKNNFGNRLLYVGLQGSYLRGEATEHSDIDIMVVIDDLQIADLDQYRVAIQTLEYADKSCGFICGKEDLTNWNPLEIHHLLNSTKDYVGELRRLVPVYNERDIQKFVKLSVNNLYHELCHRYVHGDREETYRALPGIYKSVFFILQNLHYLTCREWIATKADLLPRLEGKDYAVLKHFIAFSQGTESASFESFELLFAWCQQTIKAKF